MEPGKIYSVKNNLWVKEGANILILCNKNRCLTPMRVKTGVLKPLYDEKDIVICPKCDNEIQLLTSYLNSKMDVSNIIVSEKFKKMKIIDIDGISTPVAEDKAKLKNSKYFVTAQLMESRRGLQLAVYAGEIGKDNKAQIFVEPDIKRLAFDQKDLNPTEVFSELRATFRDGTSHTIKRDDKK